MRDLEDGSTEFLFASARLREMLGAPEEVGPGDLMEYLTGLLHEDDREACLRLNEEATAAITPFKWEGRMIIRGATRWMSVETVPRLSRSLGLVWEGVVIDITERKLTEAGLASALAAERMAREEKEGALLRQERFLAGLCHEIRSPLSAMVALTHAMIAECGRREMPAKFIGFLEQVRAGGYYLNHLLLNLLDLDAINGGRPAVNAADFYLRDLVDDTAGVLEPVARAERVELRWHLPADPDARLRSDPDRLGRILLNLGLNALKRGSREGGRVVIGITLAGGRMELRVRDGAAGTAGDAEEPGHPDDSPGPPPPDGESDRGAGLGLAIVRENCRLLGGSLTISAALGRPGGMVAVVSLPSVTPPPSSS